MRCCTASWRKFVPLFVRDRNAYLCVGALRKSRRRGVVVRCCNSSVVLRSGVTTLGSRPELSGVMFWFGVGGIVVVVVGNCAIGVGATTLGARAGSGGVNIVLFVGVGAESGGFMVSVRLSCVDISNNAFRTGYPSRKLGTVSAGGLVSIVTISSTACFR